MKKLFGACYKHSTISKFHLQPAIYNTSGEVTIAPAVYEHAAPIPNKTITKIDGREVVKLDNANIEQVDLSLSPRQQLHYGKSAVPGKSYLTRDPSILLNDLNTGNVSYVGTGNRGVPIVEFDYEIGNVLSIDGTNLGATKFGAVHLNGAGEVHIVPWIPKP